MSCSSLPPIASVERERGRERERERERVCVCERERVRERLYVCVCVDMRVLAAAHISLHRAEILQNQLQMLHFALLLLSKL